MARKNQEKDQDNKGFITFFTHADLLRELPPDEFKRVVLAIYNAAETSNFDVPDDFNSLEKVVFMAIIGDVERSINRYEERRKKRSEAGKKGMASRWAKNKNDDDENNKNNTVIKKDNSDNNVISVIECNKEPSQKMEFHDFPTAGIGMSKVLKEPLWGEGN